MSTEQSEETDLLTAFLRDSDGRCPACQYALRGCTSDRCPECGAKLSLAIAADQRHEAWWLAAVMGAATAWLMSAALLLMVLGPIASTVHDPSIFILVGRGQAPTSSLPNWPTTVGVCRLTIATSLWLAWIITRRRVMRGAPLPTRVVLLVLGSASPIITLGLIALLISTFA
jgi:hypothetical protein